MEVDTRAAFSSSQLVFALRTIVRSTVKAIYMCVCARARVFVCHTYVNSATLMNAHLAFQLYQLSLDCTSAMRLFFFFFLFVK